MRHYRLYRLLVVILVLALLALGALDFYDKIPERLADIGFGVTAGLLAVVAAFAIIPIGLIWVRRSGSPLLNCAATLLRNQHFSVAAAHGFRHETARSSRPAPPLATRPSAEPPAANECRAAV